MFYDTMLLEPFAVVEIQSILRQLYSIKIIAESCIRGRAWLNRVQPRS